MAQDQVAINLLRQQFRQSQEWLEGTLQGVTDEVANDVPVGSPWPIAGQIAHIITGLDFYFLNMTLGKEPLPLTSFAEKTGLSEPPPMPGEAVAWERYVKVDLPVAYEYLKSLFNEIDDYLATAQDGDLAREIDMGSMGMQTLTSAVNYMIWHNAVHTGEISCIKGMQGLKGYPF
ncbi:MAG: DinB family protein [Chloroflexi bacterium]|nr:DinB family protein [Chloroflexota bacterium]